MKWTMVSFLLVIICLPLILDAQIIRRGENKEQKEDYGYTEKMQKEDDAYLEKLSLAEICFVRKDQDGKDYVWLRMPPAMYRSAEIRAKLKLGLGVVRVFLRPRHHHALHEVLKSEKKWTKIMLRVSSRKLKAMDGIKDRYIVRPLEQFFRDDPSDGEKEGDNEEGKKEERRNH